MATFRASALAAPACRVDAWVAAERQELDAEEEEKEEEEKEEEAAEAGARGGGGEELSYSL